MTVEIYSNGICFCSACAPKYMTAEEVSADVNRQNPTGISGEWKVSGDTHFKGGQTNPCPCEEKPKTHQHWLLEC